VSDSSHLIGLLLGTEEDWPAAFEALVRRAGAVTDGLEAIEPDVLRAHVGLRMSRWLGRDRTLRNVGADVRVVRELK